jgi:excisionase family DNA binding protein
MPDGNGAEWITTVQAAELTGYANAYFRQLIKRGRLTARKWGRDWCLDKAEVLDYKARMDALGTDKHNPWREDLSRQGRGRQEESAL